ncbi:MAG TPA: imidazole glycerol phosphate synthase subunit HisH [Herpetosiphonaceae bacterium]|nr:imidazole glycerol phosphate synthase subunit HisH [Herpetosiphonaceae bacterium]
MIAVIDYGAGNLRSAVRALQHVGARLAVTSRPEDVRNADAVVLPGVGATRDTMAALDRLELSPLIPELLRSNVPFLGICVGMQVLAEASEEWGTHPCLGVVPGRVCKLPDTAGKVPQIGWNQVRYDAVAPPSLLQGIPNGTDFYFVHSFYVDTPDETLVAARTDYGLPFPSVLESGSLAATQFHPEKSGRWGLALLRNWVRSVQGGE